MFQINIACTIHKPSEFHPYHSAATHKARLTTGIKCVLMQVCDSRLRTKLTDKACFPMKCRVMFCIYLILIWKHNFAFFYQYSTKWFITMFHGKFWKPNGLSHKNFIFCHCICKINFLLYTALVLTLIIFIMSSSRTERWNAYRMRYHLRCQRGGNGVVWVLHFLQ